MNFASVVSSLDRADFIRGACRVALATALLAALAPSAGALQEGETPSGVRYASGGVSEAEQLAMQVRRPGFNLWVITAEAGSGAYLADVRVRVTGPRERVVFDALLDGPWLMLDLPLGRYEVQARSGDEVRTQITTIHEGDHHQAVLYFRPAP